MFATVEQINEKTTKNLYRLQIMREKKCKKYLFFKKLMYFNLKSSTSSNVAVCKK